MDYEYLDKLAQKAERFTELIAEMQLAVNEMMDEISQYIYESEKEPLEGDSY